VSRTDPNAGSPGGAKTDGKNGKKLTRDDVEAKFRELQGDLTTAAEGAKSKLVIIGGAAAVAVLVVVYVLGRRAGRKRSTVVEIRRL
jgi:hypothetical protein